MPQPGVAAVPVLCGVAGGGVGGAQADVNEQTALGVVEIGNRDL